ncbi:replication protein [Sporohalobacter salinus]|uniref:replication protein n=1 Tax=Sporohalobacter salinus TaxID=1494606 RepID=UPI001960CC32|nr:replication protein [Sporohalobacter salinus]MBM7623657.1 phage replication O-like protein O [Sporohalobacter salinus]
MVKDNDLNANIEDGYTKISNLILESLAMAKLTGVQKGLCMFLFRRTYGWGKKEDEISLKEFAQATNSSKSYVSKQLKKLVNKQVIFRTSHEAGKTSSYTFNTRVEQWHKGCIDTQGLRKNKTQGLYKYTTPEQTSSPDDTTVSQRAKERIKENVKNNKKSNVRNKDVININLHNRQENESVSDVEEILNYAREKIITNQLAYESLIRADVKKHGKKALKKAIDLAVAQEKKKKNFKRGDPKNGVDIGSWRFIQCFIDQAKDELKGGNKGGQNKGKNQRNNKKGTKDEGARLQEKAFELMGFKEG